MTKIGTNASTCTTKGNIEYYRCTGCGAAFSAEKGLNRVEDVTIAQNGHSLKHHPAVAATISDAGNEEYWECTSCGKLFSDEGCNAYGIFSKFINTFSKYPKLPVTVRFSIKE